MPLLRRRKLDRVVKDAYWAVVLDCLTDVFGVPAATAMGLVNDRRAAVDLAPQRLGGDIFYHKEPFEVARDLAQPPSILASRRDVSLDDPSATAAYESILGRHGLL
jgi:hypothetical protein